MMKNRHLSRSIADMGFFEFRVQSSNAWRAGDGYGSFYPSSKTCSDCGHKQESLFLSVRELTCPVCGMRYDRDVNAAINLKNMAVSSTLSACGVNGSGSSRKTRVKPALVKQEANS